jgi:3-dehydroquinate dehydratase / shikimate dehydrogenase
MEGHMGFQFTVLWIDGADIPGIMKPTKKPIIGKSMTLLAVPIAQTRFEKALEAIESAVRQGADVLELRTDCLEGLSSESVGQLIAAVHRAGKPALVTCRDQAEGGNRSIDLAVRTEILVGALRQGADFIDCEYRNFQKSQVRKPILEELQRHPAARLILSAHNFQGPFDNLISLYDNMVASCPQAIPKIAFAAHHVSDCLPAFDLLLTRRGNAIVIAMGPAGQITRILARKFGSLLTFACLDAESSTAPGQMGLSQFRDYRWNSIRPDTQVYGIIGNPVAHSMSPAIFNTLFEALQINAVYVPILLEGGFSEFAGFLDGLRSRQESHGLDFHGFSVTIPHKSDALEYLLRQGGSVEPLASRIGAVNTLKLGFGELPSGYNTDYTGALDALVHALGTDRHGLHGKSAAVLGAGGAARAVVAGLCDARAKVTIYNRTVDKARALAEEFHCAFAGLDSSTKVVADILVNCTSIGMHPNVNASPLSPDNLRPGMVVFDTVYNPLDTLLLGQAQAAGAIPVRGVEMFIRQAMAQFHLFTGRQAEEGIIRNCVIRALSQNR